MKKEYIYAGVSILLWSTTATATKLLLGNLNSMHITLASSLLAFIFLFVANAIKGNLKGIKGYKPKGYHYGSIGDFCISSVSVYGN